MTPRNKQFDMQDLYLVLTIVSVLVGTACYDWRAAVIGFGGLCFVGFMSSGPQQHRKRNRR